MANVFLALPVPAGNGVGAWVDVSTMGPARLVSVDGGAFDGQILLEGSNDAQTSAIPASVGPFTGPTQKPQEFTQAWNFLRVRRTQSSGVGAPVVNVGAASSGGNVFGAMTVPAGDGVGALIDLSAGGDVNTFAVSGAFTGQMLIETSTDGVNFSPTLLFEQGGGIAQEVFGVLSAARVRRRGTTDMAAPLASAGSQASAAAGGGAFPGFGGAPPQIAAASAAGAAGTASRSDHTHAGVSSFRGATGAATVTSPGATIAIGGVAPALTLDVAAGVVPALAGPAPGPSAVGTAGAATSALRSDSSAPAYRSDLPLAAAWFIDPVNGSDAATNPGTSSATALKTLAELCRRWWSAEISVNTTVNILGNVPSTDAPAWNYTVRAGNTVTFLGSLGPTTGFGGAAIDNTLFAGTVSAFTAASATPAADDIELTDNTIPVSFTASGLMAVGVLFRQTAPATTHWYALKDLGAKTIRLTAPMNAVGVGMNASLTNGSAYNAYAMWTFPVQNFGVAVQKTIIDTLQHTGTGLAVQTFGFGYAKNRVWDTVGIVDFTRNAQALNCLFDSSPRTGQITLATAGIVQALITGGGTIGDGNTATLQIVGNGNVAYAGSFVSQGRSIKALTGATVIFSTAWAVHDMTGAGKACNYAQEGGVMICSQLTAGLGMSGKGNTVKLLILLYGARFQNEFNAATPPFVAGSTTDASPISVAGASYAVASMPAQLNLCVWGDLIWPGVYSYDPTAGRIPYGGATAHTLTDNANFTMSTSTGGPIMTLGSATVAGQQGALKVNSSVANGLSIGGGTTAGIYIADPLAGGAASIAVDDYFFGQAIVGYTNFVLTDLVVGVGGAGNTLRLSYAADRVGGHTDSATMNSATGAWAFGLTTTATFAVGLAGTAGLLVNPNAGGSDISLSAAGVAANATHGFPYIPTMNNVSGPTGAPNAFGGVGAALLYNSAIPALWFRDVANATWFAAMPWGAQVAPGAGVQVTTNLPAGYNTTPKWVAFQDPNTHANGVVPFFTNP